MTRPDSNREAYAAQGFELLALNEHFVLINKAAGIGFHDEVEGQNQTIRQLGLFNRVQQCLLEDKLIDQPLFPLHRLDKGTSGLLLLGRRAEVARELGEAFSQGRVQKYYLALSKHKPKKKQGAVKGGMQKARRGAWRLTSGKDNYAHSQFFSRGLGQGYRLFLWRPRTGKTHQLRVAMKSLGSPILGDALYGCQEAIENSAGFYLHAYQLAFHLAGNDYCFQCDPMSEDRAFPWLLPDSTPNGECELALEAFSRPEALSWPV
ncbi:pseudouridine synthase [Pseudoteredinibacter isoporae]|uniref:tRNA pseudouridine32 synthase/23S rRNA pseudouridine746 synthase n=1 Tax=Pseudoteredinibacter isoporae TaxID=570281 RepID=A0A7X0JXQ7_9GAMM|nr:pseudouridine synthase [Pseudoteredinibacter isoporae]MBB6523206.1 tRNA pseudouridine32 synthase/23S rRNA pseudouridine746 synthase [Pseudoteredinibacter isoporae]NHO88724.1 RNA pseudouridine synthase [Pseudoteredinibacter isoporae]NIB22585.1 RNA pseudouridine synthase [Pseudoteredinibacter isoporae]